MILTMEELLGPKEPSEGEDEIGSSSEDDEFGENEVLVQNLDPKAALKDLRGQLAKEYDLELNEYKFWLQDSEELDDMSCLADHCIEDSGFVEVHFEIVIQGGIKKIIILDVVRASSSNNEENSSGEDKSPAMECLEEETLEEMVVTEEIVEIKEEPMDSDGLLELSQEITQALTEMEANAAVKTELVENNETAVVESNINSVGVESNTSSAGFFELNTQNLSSNNTPTNVVIIDGGKVPERSSPYKVATVSDAKMIQSAPVMELSTTGGNPNAGMIMVTTIGTQPTVNATTFTSTSLPQRPPVPQAKKVASNVIRPPVPSTSSMPSKGPNQTRPMNKQVAVRIKQSQRSGPRWVVDKKFLAEMANQNMSSNPREWSVNCVLRWYLYVKARYNIEDKYDQFWRISGEGLYELTERQVIKMVPRRCLQDFWTHLELMRKCNVIAFLQRFEDEPKLITDRYKVRGHLGPFVDPMSRSFNASTPQLWQFLLDLLSDYRYYDVIRWTDNFGQFKFFNPVEAATMWGDRKKKPYMNYEKLSRAIRYYYEDKLIVKVLGQRFTYRFTCDLKPIIGFTAAELKRKVEDTVLATRKSKNT